MSDTDSYEIQYKVSDKDLARAYRMTIGATRGLQVLVGVVILLIVLLFIQGATAVATGFAIGIVLIVPLTFSPLPGRFQKRINPHLGETRTLKMDADGVVIEGSDHSTTYGWSQFESVSERASTLFLRIRGGRQWVIIPLSACSGPTQSAPLREFLTAHIKPR